MFETLSVPFKKLGIFICAVLGMCLWTGNVLAQSEQEKIEIESIGNMNKPVSPEHTSSLDSSSPKTSGSKQAQPVVNANPIRKEILISGEGKKSELPPAPSTLSFNIFLYIVDKFKAD